MEYESETLRRLQLTELEILRVVDAACAKLGIAYFLDGGTALGAVRHGGFIPWDDDADIGMLRPDYERFLAEAPAVLGSRFVVANPRTNPQMAGMFAKVMLEGTAFETAETRQAGFDQGVFVDVFPYDRLAPDARDAARQQRACRRWQSLSYLYHSRHITVPHKGVLGACERAACAVAHGAVRMLTNPQAIVRKFDEAATAYNEPGDMCAQADNDPCDRGVRTSGGGSDSFSGQSSNGPHEATHVEGADVRVASARWATFAYAGVSFPQSALVPSAPLLFEGAELQGPAQPEAFLNQLYGPTWRELPPQDKRRNHAPERLVLETGAGDRSGVPAQPLR